MARTAADVFGFKNVGNALAIIDDPAADWTAWKPRQVVIPDVFPTVAGDQKTEPAETLWGSELFVEKRDDGEPVLYVFGRRQVPKSASELIVAQSWPAMSRICPSGDSARPTIGANDRRTPRRLRLS